MKRRDVLKVIAATSLVGCGSDGSMLGGNTGSPVNPSDPGPGTPTASNEFE